MYTQKFSVSAGSGTATSDAVDTGGRAFTRMAVKYAGTMSTGAAVTIHGSDSADKTSGTFYPIKVGDVNTAAVEFNTMVIGSGVAADQWATLEMNVPFRYFKFVTSAAVDDGVVYTVVCNG